MADVVDFADQGAESEATPPRWLVDWAGLAGGALIGVGAVLGIVYAVLLYPSIMGGPEQLAYLLAAVLSTTVLVVSAGFVVAGSWPTAAPEWPDSRSRRRACGGLLAASVCVLYFVNSLAAFGDVIAGLGHGPYLLLAVTLWLPAAAGSGLSLVRKGGFASAGRPGRPRRADALPLALLAVIVAGTLVTWLPAWVEFTFTGSMGPHSEDLTTFYTAPWIEFGAPWGEIAGSVGQMIGVVALAAAAALWRPARFGAVILTGLVISAIDSAITGIGEVIKAPPRAFFGIPDGERMTVSVSGTPWLWAFCALTAALVVMCGWLFIRSRPQPVAAPVTSTEPAPLGTADASLSPESLSQTGEAAFVRENVVGTPYSDEL